MTHKFRRTTTAVSAIDHRGVRRSGSHGIAADVAVLPSPDRTPEISKVLLRDISVTYATNSGERLTALQDINLQVRPGEFLCIVGPSGCGKSTLLHLIAGLQRQTSGEVRVDNTQVEAPGTDRILIFQELGLFPWLTVGQNVEFGLRMKGVPKALREAKIREYLHLVHLQQF